VSTRLPLWIVLVSMAVVGMPSPAAAQIEKPVRGKKYLLTPAHGPWMIMVASFSAPPPDVRTEGMTPEEAADELVFELRSQNIPAYTYTLDSKIETVETFDRLGEPDRRIYAAQRGSVCVLAGNYMSIRPADAAHLPAKHRDDPKIAIETLKWIKNFRPKFLSGGKPDELGMVSLANGGNYRVTRDKTGPLAGAFFTTNPLRSAEEIQSQNPERLSLLVKLNAGGDCSLYENKGKYTLVVASFYGKSIAVAPNNTAAIERFDSGFGSTLDQAGQDAWELARYMRQLGFEAYVWHDEHKSIVTVGSFETTDDPRISTAIATYAAKTKTHAETKQPILTAEFLTIPLNPTPQDPVRKKWIFDPQPTLMRVPKR
jgi:hypothetical protein